MDNRAVPVDHYENFPVASFLCPAPLRPAVEAIYAFARTADDIADEGDADAATRLADLAEYRRALADAGDGRVGERWAGVFGALSTAIARHRLPMPLLHALLDAFVQDVTVHRYADRTALLDYCRRSANPVGRLLLHLYGIGGATELARSDAICSALQLANFWQDLGVDVRRGRLYVPEADCRRHELAPEAVMAGSDAPAIRALVLDLVGWARELMRFGAPLVHAIPGRAGWELRAVVQGGLRILERIDRIEGDTMRQRPSLGWSDVPVVAWRALSMRRPGYERAERVA